MINHPNRSRKFSKRPITVVLTGERWFALLASIEGKTLSEQGCLAREAALTEIKRILLSASTPSYGKTKLPLALCAAMLMLIGIAGARAEPQPWPKSPGPGGSCPFGYTTSNGFCTPSQGAQHAIPQSHGNCPWGWTSSGNFCLKSGT